MARVVGDGMIPTFQSIDSFIIEGRGKVFVVENDRECARSFPHLKGQNVMIDGKVYVCVAVECHMPATPAHKGERIGIMVRQE